MLTDGWWLPGYTESSPMSLLLRWAKIKPLQVHANQFLHYYEENGFLLSLLNWIEYIPILSNKYLHLPLISLTWAFLDQSASYTDERQLIMQHCQSGAKVSAKQPCRNLMIMKGWWKALCNKATFLDLKGVHTGSLWSEVGSTNQLPGYVDTSNKPRHDKTCLWSFWPGETQTGRRSNRS